MKDISLHTIHSIMNPKEAELELPGYEEWHKQVEEDDFENGRFPTPETVGEGVAFERIRRVTGYLSGDIRRFNNAKRAEERDRVKHNFD